MESIQHIRTRLSSVKNIGTITKAMEVVSATKMRRAQSLALASRPYAFTALHTLDTLLRSAPLHLLEAHPFVAERPIAKLAAPRVTLLVLVASDRGLAGAFNGSVARAAEAFFKKERAEKNGREETYRLVLVGKRLSAYAQKTGLPVEKLFTNFGDYATPEEVRELSDLVAQGYNEGSWERVVCISTHFKTTLVQSTVTRTLLPMSIQQVKETVLEIIPEHGRFADLRNTFTNTASKNTYPEYLFEPSPDLVLSSLLEQLLNLQVLHLVLEANASEHSARMVAMKNASTNSRELGERLHLSYNNARQALITKEMIEITSAQVAAQ